MPQVKCYRDGFLNHVWFIMQPQSSSSHLAHRSKQSKGSAVERDGRGWSVASVLLPVWGESNTSGVAEAQRTPRRSRQTGTRRFPEWWTLISRTVEIWVSRRPREAFVAHWYDWVSVLLYSGNKMCCFACEYPSFWGWTFVSYAREKSVNWPPARLE